MPRSSDAGRNCARRMRVREAALHRPTAWDRARVPAGVRPRSTRLAARMNPSRRMRFVPIFRRSVSSEPRTPRSDTDTGLTVRAGRRSIPFDPPKYLYSAALIRIRWQFLVDGH